MRLWLPVFSLLSFLLLANNSSFAASSEEEKKIQGTHLTLLSPSRTLQEECEKCHNQVLEKELLKRYIHQPFAGRKCLTCHVDAKDSSPPVAVQPAPDKAKAKIRWLSISPSASAEHTFLLPVKSASGKIMIDAKAPGKSPLRQSLTIPAVNTLVKAENDQTPPRITNIKADVQQGILINAAITWQSDKKTNATVQYGIKGAGQTIEEKNLFVTDHEITLPGLKSESIYQFSITCRDIFGNSAISPIFTFSTAKVSPLPEPPPENQGASSEKIAINSSLFRINDDNVMLELTANQPVSIAIGTSDEEPAERRIFLVKPGQSPDMAEEHIPLTNKEYSSIIICSTCHKSYNQQKSHPVNILPKGKIKIPPEYPTLPDGRISCMTCHINHAANNEYRLIKSSRKELCLSCHLDKF
ncbi:MAG: hypothetical protein MUO63_10630 [Desulfobulbaceae bacterium]|nr:hypothetical protein [Desulfobulbaceae bacterium]